MGGGGGEREGGKERDRMGHVMGGMCQGSVERCTLGLEFRFWGLESGA